MKLKGIVLLALLTVLKNACAWWEAGHMLVADIAYANLSSKAKSEIKALLPYMDSESTPRNSYAYNSRYPNYTLMAMAHWPDDLHTFPNYLTTSKTWHYIEQPYSDDGSPLPAVVPRDNVVWAIAQHQKHISVAKANHYDKVRSLAYLVHFVGDIHQPLHCAELHTQQFPNGDRGGNFYKVRYKEPSGAVLNNLHALWDSGLNLFPSKSFPHDVNRPKDIAMLSKLLMADYPKSYFKDKVNELDPKSWQAESHSLAKAAHRTPYNSEPSQAYIDENTQLAEQRIVLAGYRLANLLNKAFE